LVPTPPRPRPSAPWRRSRSATRRGTTTPPGTTTWRTRTARRATMPHGAEPVGGPEDRRASPWPFVGMAGMAAAFFLYAASGLLAPGWAVVCLLLVWLALLVLAFRWWTPHPRRVALIPVVAV